MSGSEIEQLEQALIAQAESLARERLRNGEGACEQLRRDMEARIAAMEARDDQIVRVEAERLLRRQAQAAEGRLGAELDRLRWGLTQAVLSNVRLALIDLTRDPARYLPVLESFLNAAVRTLPAGDLVATVNAADLMLLQPVWPDMTARSAPGRRVGLTGHGDDSLGGICLGLADGRARVDHRFEARQERLAVRLAGVVMARLFGADRSSHG